MATSAFNPTNRVDTLNAIDSVRSLNCSALKKHVFVSLPLILSSAIRHEPRSLAHHKQLSSVSLSLGVTLLFQSVTLRHVRLGRCPARAKLQLVGSTLLFG